ncbi:MAG TPA: hypothetical protein VGM92_15750 [Candidatus Kapabacteria bacterium]
MQTYHHGQVTVNHEGQVVLSLPFPQGQKVEIVARPLNAERSEDEAWERMAFESFFDGYVAEDAIYDNYHEWRKNSNSGTSS